MASMNIGRIHCRGNAGSGKQSRHREAISDDDTPYNNNIEAHNDMDELEIGNAAMDKDKDGRQGGNNIHVKKKACNNTKTQMRGTKGRMWSTIVVATLSLGVVSLNCRLIKW